MKVIAFNGSARKDSNTAIMLNVVLEELNKQEDLSCETVDLEVLRQISTNLRSWEWACRVLGRDR